MSTKTHDKIITWGEAADRLGIAKTHKMPRQSIYRMGLRGEIVTRRIGGRLFVVESSVDLVVDGSK